VKINGTTATVDKVTTTVDKVTTTVDKVSSGNRSSFSADLEWVKINELKKLFWLEYPVLSCYHLMVVATLQ